MASIPTSEFSTAVAFPGGRHRVPVPSFLLHEAAHQGFAWAVWGFQVIRWVAAWVAWQADRLENAVLQPTRVELAVRGIVRKAVTR